MDYILSEKIHNDKGMSLVETIIAVAVLSVAVIPILATFSHTTRYNAVAKVKQRATNYAMDVMENYKAYGAENATNNIFGSGVYSDDGIDETITIKFTDGDSKEYNMNVIVEPVQDYTEGTPVFTRLDDIEATPFYTPVSDVIFAEDPKDLYDPYMCIKNVQADNGFEKSSDIKNLKLKRQIRIVIESTGKVTVSYQTTGSCDGRPVLTLRDLNDSGAKKESVEISTDISTSGGALKKVFFYYYPAYNHSATPDMHSTTVEDTFTIENYYGNVDFYLIKQRDGSISEMQLKNYETFYSLKHPITFTNQPGCETRFYNVITYNLGLGPSDTPTDNTLDVYGGSLPTNVYQGIPNSTITDNNILVYKITVKITDDNPIFNSNSELVEMEGTIVN